MRTNQDLDIQVFQEAKDTLDDYTGIDIENAIDAIQKVIDGMEAGNYK